MESGSIAKRDPVTFVIFTYNEERRIEWPIKNFKDWGPVLVVDNYSEDRTVEIARSYGCDVLMNKNKGWVEDPETVTKVWGTVQTDWIYWAFADEIADAATLTAITEAVRSGKYSIVNVVRKNFYYGKFCHDSYATGTNRIFKKHAIDFSKNTIHNFGTVTVPPEQICYLDHKRYYVRHFISNNAKSYLRSLDIYSDIDAVNTNKKISLIHIGIQLLKKLLKNYLYEGAYKAGPGGLFIVLQQIYYEWLVSMKGYELKNGLNSSTIEALNDKERLALLSALED